MIPKSKPKPWRPSQQRSPKTEVICLVPRCGNGLRRKSVANHLRMAHGRWAVKEYKERMLQ